MPLGICMPLVQSGVGPGLFGVGLFLYKDVLLELCDVLTSTQIPVLASKSAEIISRNEKSRRFLGLFICPGCCNMDYRFFLNLSSRFALL